MGEVVVVQSVFGVAFFLWLLRLTVVVAEQADAQEAAEQAAERRYGMALQEFSKVYQSLIALTEEVELLKEERESDQESGDPRSGFYYGERLQGKEREERCLTGQCDPVGCEREQCPHRTQEFIASPFRGVLHQFDGEEVTDAVLLQQPVIIDLAEDRHWEKEPAKQGTQPPTKVINE